MPRPPAVFGADRVDTLAGSLGTRHAPVSVEKMNQGAKAAFAHARHHHCEVSTFDQGLIKKVNEITATEPPKPKI